MGCEPDHVDLSLYSGSDELCDFEQVMSPLELHFSHS